MTSSSDSRRGITAATGAANAHPDGPEAREKRRITLVSVAVAVVLTSAKLAVALATGSLAMFSEAAHSGLDTVASLLTFFSVRIAGRPADAGHPYGHGRVENLSAIVQGALLLVTAAAILYESVRRIFFVTVPIESSPWTFVVMVASIGVDLWRSRMLSDAARRFHSRALEADALNFRADLFTSSVVILGLALTGYGEGAAQAGWLVKADAVAALVVGGVITAMSGRLVLQAVDVLLDRAPADLSLRLTQAAAGVGGVLVAHPVRVRESGARVLADVVVTAARTASLAEAHAITERVERAIREVEPRAETVVHIEPAAASTETAVDAVRAAALRHGMATHHEEVYRVDGALEVSVHVEFEPTLALHQAHSAAHRLADAIMSDEPEFRRVDTHIEVAATGPRRRHEVSNDRPELVQRIRDAVDDLAIASGMHDVRIYEPEADGEPCVWDITVACGFPRRLTLGAVHERTERLEQHLRGRFPTLGRVIVHAEPDDLPE